MMVDAVINIYQVLQIFRISKKYFWTKVKKVTNKKLFKIKKNKIEKNFKVGVGY